MSLSLSFQVRRESKDHATLSDLYLNNVITRLTHISDDSARLLKRVSELITAFHLSWVTGHDCPTLGQSSPGLVKSESKAECSILLKLTEFGRRAIRKNEIVSNEKLRHYIPLCTSRNVVQSLTNYTNTHTCTHLQV